MSRSIRGISGLRNTIFWPIQGKHGNLGWEPKVSFDELVDMMIETDMELARKEKTLIDAGYECTNRS